MVSELIRNVESKIEVTPTQKLVAVINSSIASSPFDLVSFCESRGIDMTGLWKVSRLYQLGETALVDFWNNCLQNNPGLLESLKDPESLYQNALSQMGTSVGSLRFLETIGFTEMEVEKIEGKVVPAMALALEESKKLVKTNIQYLIDLGVKNVYDIFLEYYELFLMDYSNFTGIFNKYDPEDLIEKLVKNIAIVEYL